MADTNPGRLPERAVEPLSPAVQQRVLAAIDGNSYADSRGCAVVLSLMDSGLRASELCGLVLDALERESGEAWVPRGKGGNARCVAVGTRSPARPHACIFRSWPEPTLPTLGEPRFSTQHGYSRIRGSLYLCTQCLRVQCGIERLTIHLCQPHVMRCCISRLGEVLTR